jgi:hypothetical protein
MTNERDEQDETMICGLSLAERDVLQRSLRELPETMPPRAVWKRIEAQAKAQGLFASSRFTEPLKWIAGAAIAATVALFALRLPVPSEVDVPGNAFPTEPAFEDSVAGSAAVNGLRAVNALMVQSRQLESDLRALPEQPQLARAGTVAAIVDKEYQKAAIDYVKNDPTNQQTPAHAEANSRERVRMINLQLRQSYAQTQQT